MTHPHAITMWDFSWLERRWPGAGYEDWDLVLDQLVERGYDAIRIDAYPHLVSADAEREWELLPVWTQQTWGAQSVVRVHVLPALVEFISKARDRGVQIALSSWFRQDRDDTRMRISSPERMAAVWVDTLRLLDEAGVLDNVLYVDLCNEFPLSIYSPFFSGSEQTDAPLRTDPSVPAYMSTSIELVRAAFPDLAYTYSFTGEYDTWREQELPGFDLIEPHLWMATGNVTDYYAKVGYGFERFSPVGYDNLVTRGRGVYLNEKSRYDAQLFAAIDQLATWSVSTALPLVTTECWAIVDYKDWPGLEWDWVNDLNARAVEYVASTGRWLGIATSNFAGPQFHGVWRDVAYHQRLTEMIRSSTLAPDIQLRASLLAPTERNDR